MEQIEHQNLRPLGPFSKYQFLKKMTQLLVSLSVFSLLLSNLSSRLSFLHSFNFYYFSTVPVQFFSHNIDKKCMFLLCNGLLVFVAKLSGFVNSSSTNSYNNIEAIKINYEEYEASPMVLESKVTLLEKEENNNVNGENDQETGDHRETQQEELNVEDGGNQEKENGFLIIEQEGKESEVFFVEENDKEEAIEFDDKFPVLDQEEEEYEDEHGMLSVEELNKKFEEFIRKMKEEIRIEAQQQLVLVN
ncbi:uncharacterized protein LOC8286849 [Ricinus communis]|uniref:Transmembrane protein n=1 Tax=Ricinus communis TaxID=3988 RepID=B9S9U5_RICCO|nr:uncharacterized protein LOC8286849 [Ricinus communis]EEF39615.1 conserved hypothetical protein [Ricinus communis]|eukprot:XP_002522764.1 uncharacterized protein LOC8286849 [Ricinus communis]